MGKLKVPSLQHMARMWQDDAQSIKKGLVRLATNGPTFSYSPLFEITREMLVFKTPYEQLSKAIERIKRDDVRENFLGLMPLIKHHFDGLGSDFVHAVTPRLYSVNRDLQIPFSPPLIYGCGGRLFFPWMSFWKSNPLRGESLSLFVTMVEEILLQDSDLEDAKFEILDFSAPSAEDSRQLVVMQASDIPRVSAARKAEMLAVFAQGYRMAKVELEHLVGKEQRADEQENDRDQASLF